MKYLDEILFDLINVIFKRGSSRHKKVHDLRVTIKRLRSLWRLVRPDIGDAVYKRENGNLRRLAHSLSHERDRDILVKLMHRLRKNNRGGRHLHHLERRLKHRAAKNIKWRKDFRKIVASADHFRKLDVDIKVLEKKLADSTQEVRQELKRCRANPESAEQFHRWRRRTKNLMYQREYLDSLGAEIPRASRQSLQKLSDHQGDAHDYQILCDFLTRGKFSGRALDFAQNKRRKLEEQTLKEGTTVFKALP